MKITMQQITFESGVTVPVVHFLFILAFYRDHLGLENTPTKDVLVSLEEMCNELHVEEALHWINTTPPDEIANDLIEEAEDFIRAEQAAGEEPGSFDSTWGEEDV